MPTAQKAELSLVRNVDTAGKADTLLRKLYVAVAVPIAERNLKYLIPEREFSGITTRKGYQVLRYFMVGATYKVGQKAEYSIREVVQWWIAPNGKTEVIARLRAMHTMYYDLWTEY